MEFKRILVLANSIKKSGRCVAGREVGGDGVCTDKWLRPISTDPDGTLMPKHRVVNTGGRPLKVFDITSFPNCIWERACAKNSVCPTGNRVRW